MTAEVNCSPHCAMIESRYNNSNINNSKTSDNKQKNGTSSECESPESPEDMKQMKLGKPPRHLSVIRHCASSAKLVDSSEFESDRSASSLKSQEDGKSGFIPVLWFGSCSEIGPKAQMEDEHVCIDDAGKRTNFPTPGAFYRKSLLDTYLLFHEPAGTNDKHVPVHERQPATSMCPFMSDNELGA